MLIASWWFIIDYVNHRWYSNKKRILHLSCPVMLLRKHVSLSLFSGETFIMSAYQGEKDRSMVLAWFWLLMHAGHVCSNEWVAEAFLSCIKRGKKILVCWWQHGVIWPSPRFISVRSPPSSVSPVWYQYWLVLVVTGGGINILRDGEIHDKGKTVSLSSFKSGVLGGADQDNSYCYRTTKALADLKVIP